MRGRVGVRVGVKVGWRGSGSGSGSRVGARVRVGVGVGVRSGSGLARQVTSPVGVARVGVCEQHGIASDGVWVDIAVKHTL